MINPFRIVYELTVFGLQALFLYVLVILIFIGVIAYVIADKKGDTNRIPHQIQYEKEIIVKEIKRQQNITKKECTRIDGCRVNLKDGSVEW